MNTLYDLQMAGGGSLIDVMAIASSLISFYHSHETDSDEAASVMKLLTTAPSKDLVSNAEFIGMVESLVGFLGSSDPDTCMNAAKVLQLGTKNRELLKIVLSKDALAAAYRGLGLHTGSEHVGHLLALIAVLERGDKENKLDSPTALARSDLLCHIIAMSQNDPKIVSACIGILSDVMTKCKDPSIWQGSASIMKTIKTATALNKNNAEVTAAVGKMMNMVGDVSACSVIIDQIIQLCQEKPDRYETQLLGLTEELSLYVRSGLKNPKQVKREILQRIALYHHPLRRYFSRLKHCSRRLNQFTKRNPATQRLRRQYLTSLMPLPTLLQILTTSAMPHSHSIPSLKQFYHWSLKL